MANKGKDFTGGLNALISGIATTPAPAPHRAQEPKQERKTPTAPRREAAAGSTAAPEQPKRGRGRPRKESTENERRTTVILNTDMLQEIKNISYSKTGREGKKVLIKDIIEEALQRYIDEYHRKH